MSAPKYCNDPDNCTYADCPTAFCDRNAERSLAPSRDSDDAELRRMLAWSYCGHRLYCDDGELQDNREIPLIDFKRDSVSELKDKMEQRGLSKLHTYLCK